MKIWPLGSELFHVDGPTDGQTDRHMTKLIVTFHNYENASKNILIAYSYNYPTIDDSHSECDTWLCTYGLFI